MATLERIERDIERAQEKVAQWQGKLKELAAEHTEQENLHIVAAVRALRMTREELAVFIKEGTLPASLQPQAAIPASRYSRKRPGQAEDAVGTGQITETDMESSESEGDKNENED